MLASHWMKAGLVFLYVAAIAIVLSQCSRLLAPPPPDSAEPPAPGKGTAGKKEPPSVWERAAQQDTESKAHALKKAKRRADYEKLEAHLAVMAKKHIPAALDELADAAAAYRRKIPDLTRLTKEARWAREAPVKEALARVRGLTADYHAADREAQKGREGPTLHVPPDADTLASSIKEFNREGEGYIAFAKLLPPFYGKVPEELLLEAIDAIARAALPADAFDPCARDASACPKPPPPEPPKAPPVPKAPPETLLVTAKSGLCVRASAPLAHLNVHARPDPAAAVVARLAPGQCGIARVPPDVLPAHGGQTDWEKISAGGATGWIRLGVLAPNSPGLTFPDEGFFAGDLPRVTAGGRYCVDAERTRGNMLRLHLDPDPRSPGIVRISPSSCRLRATGNTLHRAGTLWIEVAHDEGPSGWARASHLRRRR